MGFITWLNQALWSKGSNQKATEKESMDFSETIEGILNLSPRAQTTLLYRLIEVLPERVVKTIQLYTFKRLGNDKGINVGQNQNNANRIPTRSGKPDSKY